MLAIMLWLQMGWAQETSSSDGDSSVASPSSGAETSSEEKPSSEETTSMEEKTSSEEKSSSEETTSMEEKTSSEETTSIEEKPSSEETTSLEEKTSSEEETSSEEGIPSSEEEASSNGTEVEASSSEEKPSTEPLEQPATPEPPSSDQPHPSEPAPQKAALDDSSSKDSPRISGVVRWSHPFLMQVEHEPWVALKSGFSFGSSVYAFGALQMGTSIPKRRYLLFRERRRGLNVHIPAAALFVPSEGRRASMFLMPRVESFVFKKNEQRTRTLGFQFGLPVSESLFGRTFWVDHLDTGFSTSIFNDRHHRFENLEFHWRFVFGLNSTSVLHAFFNPDISYFVQDNLAIQVGAQFGTFLAPIVHTTVLWSVYPEVDLSIGGLYFTDEWYNAETFDGGAVTTQENIVFEPVLSVTYRGN